MKKTNKIKRQITSNIIFLLDETGSMYGSKSDTIGGFNTFISEQKKLGNKIKFTLTLFNSEKIEKRYVKIDINKVVELNEDSYNPSMWTPLNDAIAKTINEVGKLKNALFVILTDGLENYSKEYTTEAVKKLIEEKEKIGWKFLYLGVDVKDFANQAANLGILGSVNTLRADISGSYKKMSNMVNSYTNAVNNGVVNSYNTVKEFNKS